MLEPTPMETVQQNWLNRHKEPEVDRPTCWNRAQWTGVVDSGYGHSYLFTLSDGCPHWQPGSNAYTRKMCDSAGAKKTPWSACSGCEWKG